MKTIEKKEKVQRKALEAWVKAGKHGTCQIVTGLGKTFIFFHALYTMPKDRSVQHLFLAEVKDRKRDLLKEIHKYNIIFNRNILKDYNLSFACYQKVYKLKNRKVGLVGCDEIHDTLTPSYFKFFLNNQYDAILGLSAKIKLSKSYIIDNKIITKGGMLNRIAPICYNYSIHDSIKDDTYRDLKIHIIKNKLDVFNKCITVERGNRKFKTTEYRSYKYWDERLQNAMYQSSEIARIRETNLCINARARLLYDLVSKQTIVNKLLYALDTKSIIYGNSIKSLLNITPNTISSYNSDLQNEAIKSNFNNGSIKSIGSFKKLKQGANLDGLDNVIVMSYYSDSEDLLQRIGRLRDNGDIGNVFIIVTHNTQEQIWFDKMMAYYKNVGEIIHYNNVEECLEKIN